MFGTLSNALGGQMKASKTGNNIDAQVAIARGLVIQATNAANQFDGIEQQMQTIAQQMQGSQEPMLMMLAGQFSLLQTMVDNSQNQIKAALEQLNPVLQQIDNETNAIQM